MKLKKQPFALTISLSLILFSRWLPAPVGLSQDAMQVLGIFAGVLILWLTTAIDWPSLLCLAALAFVPSLKFNAVLSGSIGSSTFSFLMFTFLCTHALSKTPFVRRCALLFINSPIARRGGWSFAVAFFSSALILGSFMSPTVLFMIYLSMTEEIFRVLKLKKSDRFANMVMMGMTFTIAISSGMTPIAHVFSIMAMGFYQAATGLAINSFDFMAFGIPVGILTFVAMLLIFRFVLEPDTSVFQASKSTMIANFDKPMDLRERWIVAIFGLVVLMWIAPGLLEYVWHDAAATIDSFGTALPPLLGAVAMMIINVDGKPLLSFSEAMSQGVSWQALIMTASTLALGSALTNTDIGLTAWLSSSIAPHLIYLPPLLLILIFTLWTALQTNVSSNMVTITVVSAIALPIALSFDRVLSTPAIASVIGLMGAFAFATPPAHPNVALASSSGWTNSRQLMIYGFLLMLASVAITVFIGYPLAVRLMGY